ncbi:flavin reductase family protein [Streptomyces sp. NPDC006923]|uniref:flavin reductase family protein n=1 Tax=Streptomyces sp. NPDC006923 TaxID=3155355 RepID=UPI003400F0F1
MSTSELTEVSRPRRFDAYALRRFMGNFPTGVTVITCRRGDVVHGTTVNAFTSVSLDPPLALVALDRRSRAAHLLGRGDYVINFLGEEQRDLAMHFAGRPMDGPVPWVDETGATPRLAGTVGHLVCRPWREYDGGDHVLRLGAVEDFAAGQGRPLLFFRGAFPELAPERTDIAWSLCLDGTAPAEHFVTSHETRK